MKESYQNRYIISKIESTIDSYSKESCAANKRYYEIELQGYST